MTGKGRKSAVPRISAHVLDAAFGPSINNYFVISPIGGAAGIVIRQSLFRLSLAPVLHFSSLFHPVYLQITIQSDL